MLVLVLVLVLVLGAVLGAVVTAVASQVVQQARHPVRIALVGGEMALGAVVLAAVVALVAPSTSTMIAVKRTCLNRACCMLCVACRHGTHGYCEYCLSKFPSARLCARMWWGGCRYAPVSLSRVRAMQRDLQQDFPEPVCATLLADADYIASVMSMPDSAKPKQQRSYDTARRKIARCLEWRRSFGLESVKVSDLRGQLDCGSLYLYGYDTAQRPICWVRSRLKDYKRLNVAKEIAMHVLIMEAAASCMPPGVTEVTIIADASGLGVRSVSPSLMKVCVAVWLCGCVCGCVAVWLCAGGSELTCASLVWVVRVWSGAAAIAGARLP